MSKSTPTEEQCRRTCIEEGWKPVSEVTVGELAANNASDEVIMSIVGHGKPEFFNTELGEFANASSWLELAKQQQIRVFGDSFAIPPGVPPKVASLIRSMRSFVADYDGRKHMLYNEGTLFRGVAAQEKHEATEAPDIAVLAVIYDGGSLAPFFNLSYEDYKAYDAMDAFLKGHGFWREAVTHWWSWIYREEGV